MHFKLIIALVDTDDTHAVMNAARTAGAAGATIVSQARGEGVESAKTFLGLTLETQRDMLLFLVEEHLCRSVLETIERVARLEEDGKGIAFQINVEDAVGVSHQIQVLTARVEEEL